MELVRKCDQEYTFCSLEEEIIEEEELEKALSGDSSPIEKAELEKALEGSILGEEQNRVV